MGGYDSSVTRRGWWPLYAGWILVCACLFFALRHAEDPSRRHGRILSTDAGTRAESILHARGLLGYEAVHVAYAGRGEGAPEARWVVLCDQVPHTALREALVMELDAANGNLLRIRRPS
jgi:hypothetical protein